MKKIFFLTLVIVMALVSFGYCTELNSWGNTDIHPLLGREIPYDLMYKGVERGGTSTIVSQVSKLTSKNLAFAVLKLSGASKTFTMASGVGGQEITLVKSESDARSLILSFAIEAVDTAHTGFTSVTFTTAAGSFVTLAWIDSDVGWIITGSSGVTITY